MSAMLEHANVTVSDAQNTARWMADVFGWHIRWQGPSLDGGHSLHIGTPDQYLALYQPKLPAEDASSSYRTVGGLNHLAVTVGDIDSAEQKVVAAGFRPESHANYEPGRRFYFHDADGIEYEIVQYD
ncbi:MAG: VOC family protein [Pseudomonadota bacterium]